MHVNDQVLYLPTEGIALSGMGSSYKEAITRLAKSLIPEMGTPQWEEPAGAI